MSSPWNSSAVFSPDGKVILATRDEGVVMWDMEKDIVHAFEGRENQINFTPDSKKLIIVGEGQIGIWDIENSTFINTTSTEFLRPKTVSFAGNYVAGMADPYIYGVSHGDDPDDFNPSDLATSVMYVWDTSTGEVVWTRDIDSVDYWHMDSEISQDADFITYLDSDSNIYILPLDVN